MILPKREDGFFPEREDLPLLEVTAKRICGTDCLELHSTLSEKNIFQRSRSNSQSL